MVRFDGVAPSSSAFATSIAHLQALNIPDYVVAAPSQAWNAFGATTNELIGLNPGQFVGVELVNGSHADSVLGGKSVVDFVAQMVTRFSPPGWFSSSSWAPAFCTDFGPPWIRDEGFDRLDIAGHYG